jgi:hypothetical protein
VLAAVLLLAVDLNGSLALRGVNATGPNSWLDGGWGRLEAGGNRDELLADAHLGVTWRSEHFGAHASGAATNDHAGVVEAYVEARAELGLDEVQLRGGQFFLPTSRENKDELWQSPYTMAFSALNSWIGEEVRPIGVDLQYRHITSAGRAITAGATAFRGNDTMGTLLGWRGWSIGNRLGTYNERLPLPPLASLDRFFVRQGHGTRAFGEDLDGRTGYSARLRYALPERASVQYTYLDNRGDRALHGDDYAWATSFHLLGAEAGNRDRFTIAAEYMRGTTAMGLSRTAFVDADFYAAYLLLSQKIGRNRFSGRYESFNTAERDFSLAEPNEEHGRAWTFTWLYDLREHVRVGAEFTQFVGDRPGTPDPDARNISLEARYRF